MAVAAPNPGRTDTFRRLNRTEYRNAIRDLLALDIDAAALLPSDSASYGFDNVTVGNLSPTLLESYVSAAEKISQLAVGRPSLSPGGSTVRLQAGPDAGRRISTGFPSARAAAPWCRTRSPSTANTTSRFGFRAIGTSTSKGCSSRTRSSCCSTIERLQLFTVAPPSLATGQSAADSRVACDARQPPEDPDAR